MGLSQNARERLRAALRCHHPPHPNHTTSPHSYQRQPEIEHALPGCEACAQRDTTPRADNLALATARAIQAHDAAKRKRAREDEEKKETSAQDGAQEEEEDDAFAAELDAAVEG